MEFPPPRQSQAVPIFTTTGLTLFTLPWRIEPGRHTLTVVAKATADIVSGSAARPRDEADPPNGDLCFGDTPSGTVLYPSDYAFVKPRCDVVLKGHAFAPKTGARAAQVRFAFGSRNNGFDRRIAVFGARRWTALGPSEPETFQSVPLIYERAFGGVDFDANPEGLGIDTDVLPQLEAPEALITGRGDRPEPVGFAGHSQLWRSRRKKLGSYDEKWCREHYPFFPADFDPSYFQAAPPEQQPATIAGDEVFTLVGLHGEHANIEGSLPAMRPRCFVQGGPQTGAAFTELPLRLDTVAFDTDEMKINLVWRALLDVADLEASDVLEIYLLLDDGDTEIGLEQARERYRAERMLLDGVEQLEGAVPPANAAVDTAATASALYDQRVRERLLKQGLSEELLSTTEQQAEVSPPPPPALPDRDRDEVRQRAIALLAEEGSLDGCDLSDGDLSELDFSSRSLVGANFKNARMVACRLSHADLTAAVLAGANLSEAVLEGAKLCESDFAEATLDGAKMLRAEFGDTDLTSVSAVNLDARETTGMRACFAGGNLASAKFDEASVAMADFIGANLDGSSFQGAKVPDIYLYEVSGKVSFKDASLENARADDASLAGSDFRGVMADGAVFDGADLSGCNFVGASLRRVGLVKANCMKIQLGGCDLRQARMARADLRKASLIKANMMQASLEAADMRGADLRGASLYAAEVFEANFDDADLTGTLIGKTKLEAR